MYKLIEHVTVIDANTKYISSGVPKRRAERAPVQMTEAAVA